MTSNQKPLRPCSKFGCPNLTMTRYCEDHKQEPTNNNRYYDRYQRNKKHDRFYHSSAWIKLRDYVRIRDNGLCQQCLKEKRITVGVPVDHIIPIEEDWEKRLDEDNVWLLCQACHNKKTGKEKANS